ncbi:unnamed protein product [Linum tenue]|uniref:Uncharacterized protein n=1 Tax=Linum tenue TaxID=586396 RepID=A0AAV0GPA1_9ROSI|nr:unnamed protein product [Linum tenue]
MACSSNNTTSAAAATAHERRTADFHPTVWADFFLTHVFNDQETVNGWNAGIEALKENVKAMLLSAPPPTSSEKLRLIDVVERLGIGYHFDEEIEEQLQEIYHHHPNNNIDEDLFTIALRVSLGTDVFKRFQNEEEGEGTFKEELGSDVEGMMSLYEAGYLRMQGETILDEAIVFTTAQLAKYSEHQTGLLLMKRVARVLKRPLRKAVDRHEQLFFISVYEQTDGHDPILLKLAKLSWNFLQHLYQQELRSITRWWIDLDFATKLSFARDRLIEIYFWAVGAMWEPKFSMARYILSKLTMLVSVVDDIYDVHGTIDELEIFTTAVEKWDTSMKDFPNYMKIFFAALIDALDEVDAITTGEGRPYCLEYGKQTEKNQMRAYITEARWFAKGEVPTIEEYRRVGVYSCGYPLLAYSALCGLGDKAPKEAFDWLLAFPKIMGAVADHCRLMDDIVSHEFEQKRGHVASSVECYMNQHDVSRDEAVNALNRMVEDDWKVINEECLVINRPAFVCREVISMFVGLAKVMEVLYKDFDSYTFSNTSTMDMITALLVTPMDVVPN